MATTFNADLSDDVSKVRWKIGDSDVAKAQVQDETIQFYLDEGRSILGASKQLCLDLAAKWARYGDTSVDDQRQLMADTYKHYLELAERLGREEKAAVDSASAPGIIVGGLDDRRSAIMDCPAGTYPSSFC